MQTIDIGGQARPFHVGINQGDTFCRLQNLSLAEYAATFGDVAQMSLGKQRDFLYSALAAGAEKAGQAITFTNLTVGDWMDEPDYDAAGCLVPIISALGAQFKAKQDYQAQRDQAKNAPAPDLGANPPSLAVAP